MNLTLLADASEQVQQRSSSGLESMFAMQHSSYLLTTSKQSHSDSSFVFRNYSQLFQYLSIVENTCTRVPCVTVSELERLYRKVA